MSDGADRSGDVEETSTLKISRNMKQPNQTALVTGATSGIGYELASLFAQHGYNLVIVSRNEKRALSAAEEFRRIGAPQVTMIVQDLFKPGAADEIHAITREKNIGVDVLVNNAGMGCYGYFRDTDLHKELGIIQLNISSLVHMTKLYMADMLKGEGGKILQVASIASYAPLPLMAVYGASKAFILSFTDALIDELKGTNVSMTALIPGVTDTDFFRKAGAENTRAAQEGIDPAEVAKIGFDALLRGEHHAVAKNIRSQIFMSQFLPNEQLARMAHRALDVA
jgi:uncharacterized protein